LGRNSSQEFNNTSNVIWTEGGKTHVDTKFVTLLSVKRIKLMESYHHLWRNISQVEDQIDTPQLPFQMPRNGVALLIH